MTKADLHHERSKELRYEIREIVGVATQLEKLGRKIIWENIGDPIARGHKIPNWIKSILRQSLMDCESFAYNPSNGLKGTREFLAKRTNTRGGVQINAEDILFFNGLGDAIATLYTCLSKEARILLPSPAYPTHYGFEAFHASKKPIQYDLDPNLGWQPDFSAMRRTLKNHPEIRGILVINPGNPTGIVYPAETLKKLVALAKEFELFLIADEIYSRITYHGEEHTRLSDVLGTVPGISMQGISKDLPWPGARCGWLEFYNRKNHPQFDALVRTLEAFKRMEVCSTTLPQKAIPTVLSDPRFEKYQVERNLFLQRRSREFFDHFKGIDGICFKPSSGAFYASPVFASGLLNDNQFLPLDPRALEIIKPSLRGASPDKRLALYILASTGICLVPLSSFHTSHQGFRITLLEPNDPQFYKICSDLRKALLRYLKSKKNESKNSGIQEMEDWREDKLGSG
jgi:alanine-synthesizing transaminase